MSKSPDLARKTIFPDRLKQYVDLNTDLGQSRDVKFFESTEYELLNQVSSVNIPCAVHDSDPIGVLNAIEKAQKYNCAIGAHVGYPDPVNYGYHPMQLSEDELAAWLHMQIGGFLALAKSKTATVQHVRPHGALYAAFVNNHPVAKLVAEVLYKIDPWMMLIAPAGPILDEIAAQVGTRVIPEIYLGKKYTAKGELSVAELKENLSPQGTFEQARQLVFQGALTVPNGQPLKVKFKTLHISPTLPEAVSLGERLANMLGQPVAAPLVDIGATGWL